MRDSEFLIELGEGQHMACEHLPGAAPGYLFLHGLGSVRTGNKSESLRLWATRRGRAFTRCDFRGHGESSGTLGHVPLNDLIADTILLLEHVGPSVVVGSSMGGLVGAFVAARRPDLVTALALIAPAFGYLRRLDRSVDARGMLTTTDGRTFELGAEVIEDARTLDERALPSQITVPVLVVHGDEDEVVSHLRSRRFFTRLRSARKELWLVPGGDHRLNTVAGSVWQRIDALIANG